MSLTFNKILPLHSWSIAASCILKVKAYGHLETYVDKHPHIFRMLSPLIGLSGAFTTVVTQIIQIAEDLILGLGEFFGALLGRSDCKITRALKRLTLQITWDTIKLPLSLIYATFEFIAATSLSLADPKNALERLKAEDIDWGESYYYNQIKEIADKNTLNLFDGNPYFTNSL
jgi:hypothetical protein